MDITRTNIDSLNAELNIKLGKDDYQKKVDTVLSDYQRKVKMNGFRPGKVPMGMIRKMYGKSVLVDEINSLISKSIYEYLQENKIDILGNPLPKKEEESKIDWDNQQDFEFTYEMGLAPEVRVKIKDEKVAKYNVLPDDSLVNKYVDYLRKRHGKYVDTENSEKEDLVYGDFVELSDDESVKEGGIFKENSPVSPTAIKSDAVQQLFLNKSVGHSFVVNPKDIEESETAISTMLGLEKGKLETISDKFKFTVTRISRIELAELKQEFYDMVYGPGVIKDDKGFMDKVATEALTMVQNESDRKFSNDVVEKALSKTKIDLPDEFLKKWLVQSNEKPITPEQVEEEYETFSKGMKWQLIKGSLSKEHNVEVTEEETLNEARSFIQNQYAQYGQANIDPKELDDIAKKIIASDEERRKINDNLIDTKIIKLLRDSVKTNEVDISYEEFVKVASDDADPSKKKSDESAFSRFFKSGFKKKR